MDWPETSDDGVTPCGDEEKTTLVQPKEHQELRGIFAGLAPFCRRHWFLFGLVLAVSVGILAAPPLSWLVDLVWLRYGIVFCVLFVMTLPLAADTIWTVIRNPLPAILASCVNLIAIPIVAWLFAFTLPVTLAHGLIVAAATPCTIASAAVWTRKAGGNDAIAIMVTVLTNLVCFVATPAWVILLTGREGGSAELGSLVFKLGLLVLLPMVLAQLVRRRATIAEIASRNKSKLGLLAQLGVLSMVLIGSVRTGLTLGGEDANDAHVVMIGLMLAYVIGLHLLAWISGWWVSGMMRMKRPDRIAVAFAGSQKTLLVGLSMSIDIGVSVLPIICFHVSQLFIDTLIANRLHSQDE